MIPQTTPAGAAPPRPGPWYAHLYVQVLVAIVAGALIGHFWPRPRWWG